MDQPALATAIAQLPIPFCPLPQAYHVRWQHLYARLVPLREAKLFHAVGIFKNGNQHWIKAIETYQKVLIQQCVTALQKRIIQENYLVKLQLIIQYNLALKDIKMLYAKLTQLYTKYVQPVLNN